MDDGSVPRRQPWVSGYRIKIGVSIRFLSINLLQALYPRTLVFWLFIEDIFGLGTKSSGFRVLRPMVTSLRQ